MGHRRSAARAVAGALLPQLARRWRLLPLLLMGLSGPAALAQALPGLRSPGVEDASCRTMAVPLVYAFTLAVALGTFVGLHLVKRRLTREGWSLANALSEPTRLTIPLEWRWTESVGDQATTTARSRQLLNGPDGTPMAVTLLEASSSRMIATLGALAILMLFMGFGTFALFSFGLTCQLPAAMPAVSTFLLSGLSLFAPYVANKVSTALQPGIRSAAGAVTAAPAPVAVPPPTPAAPAAPAEPSRAAAVAVAAPLAAAAVPPESHSAAPPAPHPPPVAAPRAVPVARVVPRETPAAAPARPAAAPPAASPAPYAAALSLIRQFEGFVDHAYPDPASGAEPWTIGYGFTTLQGRPVQPGQTLSREQAEQELSRQVQACAGHLAGCIPYWAEMNDNQRSALIDFAWNLGAGFYGDEANFATISADLRERAWDRVPQAFTLYCDPGTAVSAGLLRRRQAEATLWQTPTGTAPAPAAAAPAPSPQHLLKVPYCDQLLMADGQGWRECFSATSAMLAMFWGKEPSEDVYDKVRACYGDSTSSEAQLAALRSLGLQADFQTDGTEAMLRQQIDAGHPVAVGWLCDGPVDAPSGGGHWSVIIGYDSEGFFINDPYGNCDLVNGGYLSHHDGAGLHYSSRNWLPRWRVGGSGGWLLTCRPR